MRKGTTKEVQKAMLQQNEKKGKSYVLKRSVTRFLKTKAHYFR